jgi:peptidyl-prolyl cis-trans isomerase SurA
MKNSLVILILMLLPFQNITLGQDNDILLTIDDHQISRQEFLRIYNKNQQNLQSGEKADVEEYLDLFINFKMKVIEAENRGLDTLPSIKQELEKYRNELARPYLIDQQTLDKLLKQAYERSQKEVRASHILIRIPRPTTYEDTLHAYEKIQGIRERITKKQEDFVGVAKATSDDPSVKSNGGDLGYFTALQMVYPFENKAYQMEPNQVSQPFRTRYGYHLIKKTGERQAKGQIKVAHIMLVAPQSMSEEKREEKKDRINELYHKMKAGEPFEKLAEKHSEDKSSASQGGELPWFGVGRMVPSFEKAAFSLDQPGEYTRPVKTPIGWHIIKLLDRKTLGSFEEEKRELKRKITNTPRYEITQDSLIARLKDQYNFTQNKGNFIDLYQFVDQENHQLKKDQMKSAQLNNTLFSLDDLTYTTHDLIGFINDLPNDLKGNFEGQYLLDTAYDRFIDKKIIEYERKRLPEKHPEYKYILKEYHDGILLFEIMDRQVWSKASEDTTGLKEYFQNHRENYMWGERFQGKIYLCDDKETLKKVKKMKKGGLFRKKYDDQELLEELNQENQQQVEIQKGTYQKGENPIIDLYAWNMGSKEKLSDKRPYLVKGEKLQPQHKSLEEARGAVLADYQNYLEKQWLEQLKEKYRVDVNENVLSEIKKNN